MKVLFPVLLILLQFTFGFSQSLTPATLRCEYQTNPLGIDSSNPRLSWELTSQQRNQYQSAYEIVVSENLSNSKNETGDIWSTGKVSSSNNSQIEYNGEALKSFTRYYWRVRVYNQKNEASPWSEINWFETSMMNPSDWKASWIGAGEKHFASEADQYKNDPMPLLRKSFSIKKKITSARLYITGLGYYEAHLNGKKIGDRVLDPGFTTYRKQVQYSVYDITSYIQNGNNVAGIMLGNGWYNPLPLKLFGRWDLRDYQQTGRPCAKAQLSIWYEDGTTETILTDTSWTVAEGPIMRNNIYLGEHYDARAEINNWSSPKGSSANANWRSASVMEGPSGKLTAQQQPPIRVTKIIKPIKITEPRKDTFIIDMGQNFAGVARIRVKGPKGKKITMRFGEDIFNDGTLNYMTSVMTQIKKGGIKGGPGAPATAWQEDSYTLKGNGVEVWSPQFTFHGFRYVEITGWPGKPTLESIEGLRMNADLENIGTFSCSNDMFTKLHNVIQWTFLSNVFSVQSDCPAREKMGYGADMVVSSEAFLYNYDMSNFYTKAVTDFANEQQPDGGITEIAPFTGIADRGYGGLSGPLGWQLGYPFLQQKLYEFYGDKRIVESNYPAFMKQMNFLQEHAINGLFHWDISDHEALDPKPEAFTAACFYYHHAKIASQFAGILDNDADSVKYEKLAQQIRRLIVRKYLVPGTGRFDNGTQSAQVFALWYDLSPEEEKTFDILMNEFKRHNNHVSSGIFGVKMMFDVLREKNKNEVAYMLANQEDFPGWIYMLKNGATTLWESWEYPRTGPSQNHPMFGSIDEWFYRSILGINTIEPGFSKFQIKPQPAGDLKWAKGSYHSIKGNIIIDWKIINKTFEIKVAIPPNTTAEVWIPSKEGTAVYESDELIQGNADFKILKHENGYVVLDVKSGGYNFRSDFQ